MMSRRLRLRGLSVAILGPDGVGKTTLVSALANSNSALPMRVRTVYMGFPQRRHLGWMLARLPGAAIPLTWIRLGVSLAYRAGGSVVLFDRYPYDFLLPHDESVAWWRRGHRWLLARACPPPNLVVILDAPAAVIVARKGEQDRDAVERLRQGYIALAGKLANAIVIDTSAEPEQVRERLVTEIESYVRTADTAGPAGGSDANTASR